MPESIDQIIRSLSRPMAPVPTEETPRLERIRGLRAVVFDIYGTLVSSAAGDISLADGGGKDAAVIAALEASGVQVGAALHERAPGRLFGEAVEAAKGEGVEYPEVEIREVWEGLFDRWADDGVLTAPAGGWPVEEIAVRYECAVNPVWPMPGAGEVVARLREAGVLLGIVSNAQFYTLSLFPALLGGELADLGFPGDLQVYSFRLREGKPSRRLYANMLTALGRRGVAADETLFVGNDMLKDIRPAREEGMRTALFAGDARSLRRRDGDPLVRGVVPDVVVTELAQILDVLGLKPPGIG